MSSTGVVGRINAESVSGAIILLYAIVYLISTFSIPASSTGSSAVGPAVLPAIIGVGLLGVALALIARGIWSFGKDSEAVSEESEASETAEESEEQDPRRLLVVAGLLLGYIVLFLPLGYVASTALFLFLTTMYLDRVHPVRNVLYAVIFSVGVYYLFSEVLDVTLPISPLGI